MGRGPPNSDAVALDPQSLSKSNGLHCYLLSRSKGVVSYLHRRLGICKQGEVWTLSLPLHQEEAVRGCRKFCVIGLLTGAHAESDAPPPGLNLPKESLLVLVGMYYPL